MRKVKAQCILGLVLAMPLLFAQNAPEPKGRFLLTISVDQDVIRVGSELKLNVVLANASGEKEIVVGTSSAGEQNYRISVTDLQGKSPAATKYGRALKGEPWVQDGKTLVMVDKYMLVHLPPSKTLKDTIVLNKLYDLSQPGKYRIQAERYDEERKVCNAPS